MLDLFACERKHTMWQLWLRWHVRVPATEVSAARSRSVMAMLNDGNGWSAGPNGARMWGRFGAAGLLAFTRDGRVLMQHRADWTSQPLTWGLPGGARDSHESAEETALRESFEETGLTGENLTILHDEVTFGPLPGDETRPELNGDWTYTTVYAFTEAPLETFPNEESLALVWVPIAEIADLELHPGFRHSWEQGVRATLERLLSEQ